MTEPLDPEFPFGWKEHQHRPLIHAETHARPVSAIIAPATVRRVAFMSVDRGRDLTQLQRRMAELAGISVGPKVDGRQLDFVANGHAVTWEMHNEFATLTWQSAPGDTQIWPTGIGLEWHDTLDFVAAIRVEIIDAETIGPEVLARLDPASLCHSQVYGGQAQVATDFRPDAQNFVTFWVAARGCGPQRRGVIARRLFEIETYRSFALLGLPVARQVSASVATFEQKLSTLIAAIGEQTTPDGHRLLLDRLHELSVDAGTTMEASSFRFSATQAYGRILNDRLPRLGETAVGESTTLQRYLENRMQPALSTCAAVEKRLADLTTKVQRSIELLDTRISVSLQTQNQAVLDTILSTAQSQYRLQETVEGLSIIAISYYALGIIGYVLEGLHSRFELDKPLVQAICAPFVVLLVFIGIRSVRRRFGDHADHK